jgi:hypothetical protein
MTCKLLNKRGIKPKRAKNYVKQQRMEEEREIEMHKK